MNALGSVVAIVERALAGPHGVPEGTPITVACSGGADSVALVAALAALQARWPLSGVAFVDHGLRDVSDERSAARAAAERAGVRWLPLAVRLSVGGNLQGEARAARYAVLLAAADAGGVVATGHTATDQAETVLQRLVRGSGLRGLAGIAPREGRLVRPLLGVSRATTRALGLPFADDPSNATGAYLRNRMRHDVMPLLAAENPQVERALADVADQARAELELIDALAGAVELAAVDLRGLRAELADVLLRWRWRREVGGAPPSAAASAQLAAQLVAGATAATSLGAGVLGRARRGRLAFEPAADRRLQVVAHGPGTYRLSALHLELEELSPPLPSEGPPEHAATAVVPADGLRWPLTIRRIEARARRGPGGLPTLPNAPSPLAPHDNPTGAPKAEFLITDALGERLWPPRPGAPPAPSQRWLCVRAHRCTTPGL